MFESTVASMSSQEREELAMFFDQVPRFVFMLRLKRTKRPSLVLKLKRTVRPKLVLRVRRTKKD